MSSYNCLDLVFTMDATGSMGKYIKAAQDTIRRIVDEITSSSQFKVRLGLVEYRDHHQKDLFIARGNGLTSQVHEMQSWLNNVTAGGGEDTPEAVADGLLETLKLWTSLSSGVSAKNARVCVLIADAPPHGLCDCGDSYPNGCPNGHDPLDIANRLAEKGVTIYVVGCEPSISPYRDFFMAIAKITGGLYIPLSSSNSLSQVIIGCSREEISLRELMETVENEVKQEHTKNGGIVNEEEVSIKLFKHFKERNTKIKQLQMEGGELPKISPRAKRYSRFDNMANLKKKFIVGERGQTSMSSNPMFYVVDEEISRVQRMVQKAIMIHHLAD